MGVFVDVGVHVTGPGVEEDGGTFGDDHAFIFDVALGGAGEGETEDGVVAEDFSGEGGDVGDTSIFAWIGPDFFH